MEKNVAYAWQKGMTFISVDGTLITGSEYAMLRTYLALKLDGYEIKDGMMPGSEEDQMKALGDMMDNLL